MQQAKYKEVARMVRKEAGRNLNMALNILEERRLQLNLHESWKLREQPDTVQFPEHSQCSDACQAVWRKLRQGEHVSDDEFIDKKTEDAATVRAVNENIEVLIENDVVHDVFADLHWIEKLQESFDQGQMTQDQAQQNFRFIRLRKKIFKSKHLYRFFRRIANTWVRSSPPVAAVDGIERLEEQVMEFSTTGESAYVDVLSEMEGGTIDEMIEDLEEKKKQLAESLALPEDLE